MAPELFDWDWKFHLGGAQGAEAVDFDDSLWRRLDLPHDWSIEDLTGTQSPFKQTAISQVSGGFTTGGTGWYRKKFTVPAAAKGKRVLIQFDGVYMNAEVWLNGQTVGTHPYGYTSFWFDLTDRLKFGESNVLAVKVKNEGENSRWYSGSGIYRHVWLRTVEPVHVVPWGIYITSPDVTAAAAEISVRVRIQNDSGSAKGINIITKFFDDKGREITRSESAPHVDTPSVGIQQKATINSPRLWSPDSPTLYTAVT